MRESAVEQARRRLEAAERALDDIRGGGSADELRSYWTSLLIAVATIYSKLEQGAKGNDASSAWFGRYKHERKTDPLLSYLHHARNTDEHGIEEVSSTAEFSVTFQIPEGMPDGAGAGLRLDENGKPIGAFFTHPEIAAAAKVKDRLHVSLVEVRDGRSGKSYKPPFDYQGQNIDGSDPEVVGPLALIRIRNMVEEAAVLVERQS